MSLLNTFSEIVCPPITLSNTDKNIAEGEFDDSVVITCDVGYTLPESGSMYTAKCLANGKWDRSPSCISKYVNRTRG